MIYGIAGCLAGNATLQKILGAAGQNSLAVVILHFVCFKVVNLFATIVYGLPVALTAASPILITKGAWWILYTIAGVGIPTALNLCRKRVWKKLVSDRLFRVSGDGKAENFYHGFVLGLLVDLADRYTLTSNRESGFGRYDVMLEPKDLEKDDGIIIEFKVQDKDEEQELLDTVKAAVRQIEEKHYEAILLERGIVKDRIRKYGFAFCGKTVLIGK